MITVPSRRRFLFAAGALLAAPAIARAASLMPISAREIEPRYWGDGIHDDAPNLNWQVRQGKSVWIKPLPYFMFNPMVIGEGREVDLHAHGASLTMMAPIHAIEARRNSKVSIDDFYVKTFDFRKDGQSLAARWEGVEIEVPANAFTAPELT